MSNPSSLACYRNSPYMSYKHSTYFDVYDRLFGPYAGKKITFIEVGVLNGGSLFMWREFFGKDARIVGIDLNPAAKKWEKDGFEIFIGSQSDRSFWKKVLAEVGEVDVLLDDGGHTFEQQIITVEEVLPHVRDGGLILVEDTHTSYMKEFGGPSRYSFVEYAKNIVDGINHRFAGIKGKREEKQIFSVSFFDSFVAFDVSRALSGLPSEPTDNGGETMEAADFRYADSDSMSSLEKMARRFRSIGNLPVIGPLAGPAFRQVLALRNSGKARALRRFFRY